MKLRGAAAAAAAVVAAAAAPAPSPVAPPAAIQAVVAAAAAPAPTPVAPPAAIQWQPVRIGGGGLVPSMFFHEADPVAYFKTDVGGAYARQLNASGAVNQTVSWRPLLDWLSADAGAYYSVSELVLDPSDGNSVTALLGMYTTWGPCMVARSTDGGGNWSVLVHPSNWSAPACNGNGPDRASGERMAQHPTSGVFLMAAYDGHVYVSPDDFASGAAGVATIDLPGVTYPSTLAVRSVAFLPYGGAPGSGGGGGVVALAAIPNHGLWLNWGPDYASNASWVFAEGSNATLGSVNRLIVDAQKQHVYFTRDGGWGRMSPVQAPGGGGAWSLAVDWTHSPPDGYTYNGGSFNPANREADLVFMSLAINSTTTMWRTLDGGGSWFAVNWTTTSMVPWAYRNAYGLQLNSAASIHYDPHAPALYGRTEVWVSDFFGVWRSTDWDAPTRDPAAQVTFGNAEWGHEEMCVFFLRAPAAGWAITGAADNFGWLHTDGFDAYPPAVFPTPDDHNLGWALDYTLATTTLPGGGCSVPATMWLTAGDEYGSQRAGWWGNHHWVGVSHDGGQTWAETAYDAVFNDTNAIPYRIAVHPFNGSVAVITGYQGYPVVFTADGGATWANATVGGQPLLSVGPWGNFWWAAPLVRENNNAATGPGDGATMYYYNGTTSLFTSTDSGATWDLTYAGFPTWSTPLFGIAVPPRGTAAAGDIWAFAGWQLHRSTNGGANFSSVWQFYSVKSAIAVGPLPNATSRSSGRSAAELSALCARRLPADARPRPAHPALRGSAEEAASPYPFSSAASAAYVVYAAGQLNYGDPYGIFASVDYGNTWVDVTVPAQRLGDGPNVLEASLSAPGTLLVGTDGRGAFYADVTGVLLGALEGCERDAV